MAGGGWGPGHDGPPEDIVIRRRDGTFEQVEIPIAGYQSESKFDRNTDTHDRRSLPFHLSRGPVCQLGCFPTYCTLVIVIYLFRLFYLLFIVCRYATARFLTLMFACNCVSLLLCLLLFSFYFFSGVLHYFHFGF